MGNFYGVVRETAYVIQPNGWPNVADNAECVKEVITYDYWGSGAQEFALLAASLIALLF